MTTIITLLIVLYKIPFINMLGDKDMGYYSIALTIYLLLMTCISYGVPKALSTIIAEQSSNGKYALLYKTTMSSFIYALLVGGFSTIFIFFGADIIAIYFMNAAQSSMAIRMISPSLLFVSVAGVLHGIYKGTKIHSISKTAHWIEESLIAVLSVLFVYIVKSNTELFNDPAYSSSGAALGFTCAIFITCVFLLVFFFNHRKKLLRMVNKDANPDKTSKKDIILLLIRTMIPFVLTFAIYHLSNLIDYAIFNRIMSVQGHKENSYMILLGMLNGKYEFFISLPLLFVSWYASSKVPTLSKMVQEGNKRKIFYKISKSIRLSMLYIIPSAAFYILYANPLMNLLFKGTNDTPAMMLRIGAISIIFYSLAAISNAVLNALDEWSQVSKNAFIALGVQIIVLMILMIIFQWTIIAVVVSRIIFSAALFILNEHTLRERIGYVQEKKRSFTIPLMATLIMSAVSFVVYLILNLFIGDKIAVVIAFGIAIPVYILALIFTGGITQREMYRLPGGKYLAPLCKKFHLIK